MQWVASTLHTTSEQNVMAHCDAREGGIEGENGECSG